MSVTKTLRLAKEQSEGEQRAGAMEVARATRSSRRITSSYLSDTPKSAAGQIDRLFAQYKKLAFGLPWEILDYVELLATWNPDYSQACENIKMIANSGHVLHVDASAENGKNGRKAIKSFLEDKARTIQESHGGIDGIVDKLIKQGTVYGAMCGEWVLNEELTEVIDFVDLNPKNIRYFWEEDVQRFAPYQKVTRAQAEDAEKKGQKVLNGIFVKLNELTFRYYAFDAAPESPYGTPPFLSALANIAIQRDMVHNMAQIIKKIGLLGIIDLTVERLEPLAGESDDQYASRCGAYLDAYIEVAEDMAKEGGLVHFDDVTANSWTIGGNAAGATNLHKANEEMVFSGLKSMPSVQGRSYSTTETYAGVAYDIIIRNTYKYQKAVKRMLESGYWLMCQLNGMNPEGIRIEWNENRSLDRLAEAQAEKVEIANAYILWVLGVIDQTGVAQRVGYSDVKTPMERPPDITSVRGATSSSSGSSEGSGGNTSGNQGDSGNNNGQQQNQSSAEESEDFGPAHTYVIEEDEDGFTIEFEPELVGV